MSDPDNKAKLGSTYYFIQLAPDWESYTYAQRESVMDQDDRYNFATANWSYDLEDLRNRAFDVLHTLTCKSDEEIAAIILRSEDPT